MVLPYQVKQHFSVIAVEVIVLSVFLSRCKTRTDNGDRKKFSFPIQLPTSRIGNYNTSLINYLLKMMTINTYIDTFTFCRYFQHTHFIPIVEVGKKGEY